MNNQEILQKIVAYIEAIMVDKSMTSRDLAEICVFFARPFCIKLQKLFVGRCSCIL